MRYLRLALFGSIALIFASSALAASAPCAVETVGSAGLPGLAAGLDAPAPPAVETAPVEGPEVSAKACSAVANCANGSSVSCSTGGSGTCQGVNASCPNERGYVRCGSQYTYCPSCPAQEFCAQGASCGLRIGGLCGYSGSERGVCYQGACRCWCSEGTSCSTDSDCGPSNTPGGCSNGTCYCL